MGLVYLSFAVPQFEYLLVVWAPYCHLHNNTLEKVHDEFSAYYACELQWTIEDHNNYNIRKELNPQKALKLVNNE